MELAWFIYTIAVIFIAIVACAVGVMVWVLTNRRGWAVSAAVFACYAFEQAIIFFAEYSGNKPYLSDYFVHGLEFPLISIPLSILFITLLWVWVGMRVHAPIGKRQVVLFVVSFAAVSLLVAPVGPWATTGRTFAYFAARDFVVIGSLVFAALYGRYRATENEKADILRARGFWILALVLAVLVLVEDIVFILVFDPTFEPDTLGHSFFWYLTERNLSENILMIACAIRQISSARDIMRVFAQHPAEHVTTAGSSGKKRIQSDIDIKMPVFCDNRGMSKREREVMRLVLLEKNTQEIASELVLSVGTVKAHLHRIYLKAGVTSRQDLIKTFWRS